MESKLNNSSIEAYSTTFSKKVSSDFFQNSEAITGHQIIDLCIVKQINFFIIKNLLQRWKKEAEKLKSPYFNYDDPEVASALKTFLNTLSQKIYIKQADFEPLLKQAVNETILLLFSPQDYLINEIKNSENTFFPIREFQESTTYIKINASLVNDFLEELIKDGEKEVPKERAITLAREVSNRSQNDRENYDEYINKLSITVPLSKSMIFLPAEAQMQDKELELINSEKQGSRADIKNEKNTNFFKEQQTLNEKHTSKSSPTLADLHQKKKIDNIKNHISIYQKFMFINELFNGKTDEFNEAVERLEHCEDYEEAIELINSEFSKKYRWNSEADDVNEFLEIIEKRFS